MAAPQPSRREVGTLAGAYAAMGVARWVTGVLVAIGSAGGSLIPLGVVFLAGARPAGSLAIAAALLLAAVLCTLLHSVRAQRAIVASGQPEG